MPMEIPPAFLFLCFLFGSLSGYLAYFSTSLIEKIDAPNMRPFGLLAYLAFIFMVVTSRQESQPFIYIISGVFIALIAVGVVIRGNSTSVLDRLVFFGCAILMSPFLAIVSLILLIFGYEFGCSIMRVRPLQLEDVETGELFVAYIAFTTFSVFAAPLLEQLYRFAMSMRSKPN